MSDSNVIGKIIHEYRVKLGLTLEEVGKAVGVGKSTVKKWEDGFISNMRRDKIALLADVLNLSPLTFITGVVTPKQVNTNSNNTNEVNLTIFIENRYGKSAADMLAMYSTLDIEDKAEIRGEIRQMLKADKYKEQKKNA